MAKKSMIEQLIAARRVSTPLVVIITPDPTATVALVCKETRKDVPKIRWDCVKGPMALNQPAQQALSSTLGGLPPDQYTDPVAMMKIAEAFPERTILFMDAIDRFIAATIPMQAFRNLRNPFKTNGRTLIGLSAELVPPPELRHDVIVIEEELPADDQLREIVTGLAKEAKVKITQADASHAVDATRGLSAYSAEQIVAMSLTKEGIELDQLWERKRVTIAQTPGVSMTLGGPTFADVGGLCEIQSDLRLLHNGPRPFKSIVHIDEIDKQMAGATGQLQDNTGVAQDIHMQLLTSMEDEDWTGIICIGPPGSGKSLIAKTAAATLGIPNLKLDTGALKGMYLGQSETNTRAAMRIVRAVAGKDAFFVATCNRIETMSPELRRRFRMGTYFFDLPDKNERKVIWTIHKTALRVNDDNHPVDDGWSGANIRDCVDIAHRKGCSLVDAATKIVPASCAAPEELKRLREHATGRYLSASFPGFYDPKLTGADSDGTLRQIQLQ